MPGPAQDGRRRVAVFVSPHGFGHAARAAAVMAAIRDRLPAVCFEVFTTVPAWFFTEALDGSIRHHPLSCDVGLVQHDALHEDPTATVGVLARRLPFDRSAVMLLAGLLDRLGVGLVVADIAPLGLAVATAAGIPSLLVENFTWDFIYRGCAGQSPALGRCADLLEPVFAQATLRVRTRPACGAATGDVTVGPISRRPRHSRAAVRAALAIPDGVPAVLVTMGGIPSSFAGLDWLRRRRDAVFIVPGTFGQAETRDNLRLLPHHSRFYHPDLVAASDGVIGKLGYSTVAETWAAGVPFAWVPRPTFPESASLAAFVTAEMDTVTLLPGDLAAGRLDDSIERLLEIGSLPARKRHPPRQSTGAAAVAALAEALLAGADRRNALAAARDVAG